MKRSIALAMAVVTGIGVAAIGQLSISSNSEATMNKVVNSHSLVQADKSSEDYKSYSALLGENYDKAFIANMIVHHQGAVDMAKLALKYASHNQIKALSLAILATQSTEISEMTAWGTKWGYNKTGGQKMKGNNAKSMAGTNAMMMSSLRGKVGVAFDQAFLTEMIGHHQSAINMATPGLKNAQHAEVKKLAKAIIIAQSKEIKQMKQWQSAWGLTSSAMSDSMPGMNR